MSNKLLISGDIDSGWATIKVESNETSFILTTSYVFDGLTNLLTAISLLNKGLEETETSFIDEPNEHIIHFSKTAGSNNLIIKYFTFDNFNGRPLIDRIGDSVQAEFVIETTLKRLTVQTYNLFDHFRQSYGIEGYNDRWRHVFPSDKVDDLRNNWC